MSSIPKKDGGTRTIAIAATLYRLLMQLDNDEIEAFEKVNAFKNDSAKAGSSAIEAAEDRAWLAELAKLKGKSTI